MNEEPKNTKIEDLGSKPIMSLRDLEYRLGEDRAMLRALAKDWQTEYKPYQQVKAPKPFQRVVKAGKVRDIDNPSKGLKRVQKKILKRLLLPVKLPYFLFGAVSPRDVKQHAEEHLGQKTVVKMDVKGYYPSVTSRHIYDVWNRTLHYSPRIARLLTQLTTYEWHLPQGAPTSPALANIFLASVYGPVLETCSEMNIIPTAWVDDLIFSGPAARSVMELVRRTLAACGFKMSSKKRIILTGRDPKIITGIRLGAGRARAPKEKLSDIRAAIHKLEIGAVSSRERPKYIASLKGRLKYIERICSQDASRLISKLESVLTGANGSATRGPALNRASSDTEGRRPAPSKQTNSVRYQSTAQSQKSETACTPFSK